MDIELHTWIQNNTETKSKTSDKSKLRRYQNDILILRDKGYSFKQIQQYLVDVKKMLVTAEAVRLYYHKHKSQEDCEPISTPVPEEHTNTQPTHRDNSSKTMPKKKRTVAEFMASDPMFQKVLGKKEQEKTQPKSTAPEWKKVSDFEFPTDRAKRVKAIWDALKTEKIYPKHKEQLERELEELETKEERQARVSEMLSSSKFLNQS